MRWHETASTSALSLRYGALVTAVNNSAGPLCLVLLRKGDKMKKKKKMAIELSCLGVVVMSFASGSGDQGCINGDRNSGGLVSYMAEY